MSAEMRGHLLLFMQTECQCNQLPASLVRTRSMHISIHTDAKTQHQFRVHAWECHHGQPWFDAAEVSLAVEGHDDDVNCIGLVRQVGELRIPDGPRKGTNTQQHPTTFNNTLTTHNHKPPTSPNTIHQKPCIPHATNPTAPNIASNGIRQYGTNHRLCAVLPLCG